MMGISGETKPLKTMLISPWMVYQLQFNHHRYINNNLCSMFRTFYKYELSDVSMDNEKCFILLPCLTFPMFYRYMSSWTTTQRNIVKSKMCGIQPVNYEEDGYCEKGLMFDEYFLSKSTYDAISGSLSHLCIVSGVTIHFNLSKQN